MTAIPGSNWVNVRDFGAGTTGDDAPAFLAAIDAIINQSQSGRYWSNGTVYGGSTGSGYNSYVFPNGLTLPWLKNGWVELYLDCNLSLGAPIVVGSGYYIHGHNAGPGSGFATMSASQVYAGDGVSPAFHLMTAGARLENLSVSTSSGDVILLTNASSMVNLIEVHASTRNSGASGSPLHIIGGFGIHIEGGGYEVQPDTDQPTILIETPPDQTGTSIISMDRIYLANRGIQLLANPGYIQNVRITRPLYESGRDALVNLRGTWPGIINGLKVEDSAIADSDVAVIDNQATRVFGVKIDNCPVHGGVLTTGSPMSMLTIWHPGEPGSCPSPGFGGFALPVPPKIAQTRGYVMHFGDRIINTIPVVSADKWDTQAGFIPC
jgi:hypothetical protein